MMSAQKEMYLYRYFEAIYRTHVEYCDSVTRQTLTTTPIMHKKDSFVSVLSHVKLAISLCLSTISNEPPHDKTNNMTVRPVKTQIRLGDWASAQSDQSLRCTLNG